MAQVIKGTTYRYRCTLSGHGMSPLADGSVTFWSPQGHGYAHADLRSLKPQEPHFFHPMVNSLMATK